MFKTCTDILEKMAKNGCRVCSCFLLAVICFSMIVPSSAQYISARTFHGPVRKSNSLDAIKSMPPVQGFSFILRPLDAMHLPSEIMNIRGEIMQHVSHGSLQVAPIIQSLNFQNKQPQEIMMQSLYALYRSLPKMCEFRRRLEKLLNFISNPGLQVQSYGATGGVLPFSTMRICDNGCTSVKEIIQYLVDRIVKAEQSNEKCQTEKPQEVHNYAVEIDIPSAMANETQSEEVEIVQPEFGHLMTYLPQPVTEEERHKFNLVQTLLTSNKVAQYLHGLDLTAYADEQHLLKAILIRLSESQLDASLLEAISYFLHRKSMANLDLVAHKEIKKHFDLTSIFSDTLDFFQLNAMQRVAFNNVFNFIASLPAGQMNSFTEWSDVRTRGEFTKVLFTYFINADYVPVEIKQNIQILFPLIKMDGKGALAP